MINHDQSNLGGKGFILPYSLKSVIQGSQGGNLVARTEMKTTEELGFLAYSAWPAQLPFLQRPGPPPAGSSNINWQLRKHLLTCPQKTVLIWSVLPVGRLPGDSGYVKLIAEVNKRCFKKREREKVPVLFL